MSGYDFGWGYIFGREQGKQDAKSEINSGGGGGDIITLLIAPLIIIELFVVGLTIFGLVSSLKGTAWSDYANLLSLPTLNLHSIFGVFSVITGLLIYFWLHSWKITTFIIGLIVTSVTAIYMLEVENPNLNIEKILKAAYTDPLNWIAHISPIQHVAWGWTLFVGILSIFVRTWFYTTASTKSYESASIQSRKEILRGAFVFIKSILTILIISTLCFILFKSCTSGSH